MSPPNASPNPRFQPVLLVGYLAVTIVLALMAAWAHSALEPALHVFHSFGGDLPWITSLLIDSTPYWGVLPLLSFALGLCVLIRRRRRRDNVVAWAGLSALAALTVALPVFTFIAFYEPIRRLGEPIQTSCGLACMAQEAWQRAQRR